MSNIHKDIFDDWGNLNKVQKILLFEKLNKVMIMTVEKDDKNRNNECHVLKIENDHYIEIYMTC